MIECNISNCAHRYIGDSERTLKDRMSEHIGYIRMKKMEVEKNRPAF